MAPASAWFLYNDFKLGVFQKLQDMDSDTFAVALVTAASNAIDVTKSPATYASINNELPTANGYTSGGFSVGVGTLSGGAGIATITFDVANASWTASGAGFTARAGVLYNVTTGLLVAYFLLDSTPADVTVAPGNTLTIQISNVFTDT